MTNIIYITFLIPLFVFNSVVRSPTIKYTFNLDTVFTSWNNATLLSLKNEVKMAESDKVKKVYENSLLAFKSFIDIKEGNKVNPKSIRYKFLKDIPLTEDMSAFYIIETISSGESVELRNYVINPAKGIVTVYQFINGKWIKSISEKISFNENVNLNSYVAKFGTGFNQDDIIITSFNNKKAVDSKYFVYSTMKNLSPWNNILKLR